MTYGDLINAYHPKIASIKQISLISYAGCALSFSSELIVKIMVMSEKIESMTMATLKPLTRFCWLGLSPMLDISPYVNLSQTAAPSSISVSPRPSSVFSSRFIKAVYEV